MKTPRTNADSPPAEVAADPAALEVWTTTVAALRENGLWTSADRAVVARYSLLSSLWAAAQRDVAEHGTVMRTRSGYESVRVSAVLVTKLAGAMLAIENALGMNPRGRQKLKAAGPKPEDDPEYRLLQKLKVRL